MNMILLIRPAQPTPTPPPSRLWGGGGGDFGFSSMCYTIFYSFRGTQREHVVRHMITVHKVQPEMSARAKKKKKGKTSTVTSSEESNENNMTPEALANVAVYKGKETSGEEGKSEENEVGRNPALTEVDEHKYF